MPGKVHVSKPKQNLSSEVDLFGLGIQDVGAYSVYGFRVICRETDLGANRVCGS